MKKKQCNKCNRSKKLSLFVRSYRASDGYLNVCKACHAKHMRELRTPTGSAVGRPRTRTQVLTSQQLKRLVNRHQ